MALRGQGILVLLVALLGTFPSAHSGTLLCLHTDGSSALESGTDRCCRAELRLEPRSTATWDAAAGCPGCEDRLLTIDSRLETRRLDPLEGRLPLTGFVAPSGLPGARASCHREHTRHGARGAPAPLALRI